MDNGLNVTRLQIKNFLSISEVELKPGKITQICGMNNAGKTTILRALETAVKGSSDGTLVKHGETQAEIIVEFSDGMSIRRRISAEGKQDVKVTKNEMEAKAPQGLLNSLFAGSAFNPLELLDPKRRTEALLQAIPARLTADQVKSILMPALPIELPPLDYDAHGLKVVDQLHDYFYARRAEANKIAKTEMDRLKFLTDGIPPEPEKSSLSEQAISELIGELDAQIRNLSGRVQLKTLKEQQSRESQVAIDRLTARQSEIAQQLALLQQESETNKKRLEEYVIEKGNLETEIAGFKQDDEAERKIREDKAKLEAERTKNANYRAWAAKNDACKDQHVRAHTAEAKSIELNWCVEQIRTTVKEKMMQGCEMPVPGITYQDGNFFFEGCAIENLSTSAAMKLAVGLARALAGKAKVICLDGAEALDDANFANLCNEVQNDGFTYFITKVGLPFPAREGHAVVEMAQGVAQ